MKKYRRKPQKEFADAMQDHFGYFLKGTEDEEVYCKVCELVKL